MSNPNPQYALPWWKRGVIYQIYPRSFMDTTGNLAPADGIGDLQGIIDRLDYLNGAPDSLGVDAIWLSPFYPSPMADFGYDVSDYCNVHPLFGDLATFDRLVAETHQRGMRIIIDWVPNHTSNQHPWFLESRLNRTSPRREWYIWRDPKPDGSPPNNWGAWFGGSAWEWDDTTRQYYLHSFLKEQPDLNWRNPEVKQAMLDTLRFWLERGVDGFRMDVLGMIYKHPDLPDNPHHPNPRPDLRPNDLMNRLINIYNQDQDDVHDVLREIRRLVDDYGETCIIGEIWYETPRWIKYYGEHGEGIHLPFNFRLINLPWKAQVIRKSVDDLESALPPFAWPNYVLDNHDQRHRLASKVGAHQARLAAMLLLTLRGTPTMYYGDEIGMEDGLIASDKMQDPFGITLGPEHGRDYSRTPMQWNDSPYAGFSTTEPWLPVSGDYRQRNVAQQNTPAEQRSLLNLYRRLLHLRKNTPALFGGSYQPVDVDNPDCYVFLRQDPSGRFLIALNFVPAPATLVIPSSQVGTNTGMIVLSSHLDRFEKVDFNSLKLRSDEGIIVDLG